MLRHLRRGLELTEFAHREFRHPEAGWYLASVRVGSDQSVATEDRSFGAIKGLFR